MSRDCFRLLLLIDVYPVSASGCVDSSSITKVRQKQGGVISCAVQRTCVRASVRSQINGGMLDETRRDRALLAIADVGHADLHYNSCPSLSGEFVQSSFSRWIFKFISTERRNKLILERLRSLYRIYFKNKLESLHRLEQQMVVRNRLNGYIASRAYS